MIYRSPFEITPSVLVSITEIERLLGRYEGIESPKPEPHLRRDNKIRTVLGSVAIEGNTLTPDQVTAILENKRVSGPERDIREVQNAIETYARARAFDPTSEKDLLEAHAGMMKRLIEDAGRYRRGGVGVFEGVSVAHVAPPAKEVPRLIDQLLSFLKGREIHPIIHSVVVHYELEFIHPFSDGNGRMGRLWQHVVLLHYHPVFEYLPIESVVHAEQAEYYRVLGACDKAGNSSLFIQFSLKTILESLAEFMSQLRPERPTAKSRLEKAREAFGRTEFSRKDYLEKFTMLSTATASRDLKEGVESEVLEKLGDMALTRYRFR